MDIPIVLIHKSDHVCLQYSLRAAHQYHDDITLITDIKTQKYNKYCKTVDIYQLKNNKTEQFSKVYQHLSSNSYEFEYICFERWFLLLEYMQRNELEQIIYIDSDVMVYENLSNIIKQHYSKVDISLCTPSFSYKQMIWVSSGHTLYITRNALEQVCDFILETYTNNMEELLLKWNWHKQNNRAGGINDMTLLYLFQRNTTLKVGNFLEVKNNSFCFDSQINSSQNMQKIEYDMEYSFLLNKEIKKVFFKNRHPFVFNKLIQKKIQFITLHFQSDAKNIMPVFIKDKKNFINLFLDLYQTSKVFYYALRRELSNKIRS